MSTQPANLNKPEISFARIPAERPNYELHYGYLFSEADKAPEAIQVKFGTRYAARRCAIGLRSILGTRPYGIKHEGSCVWVWKIKGKAAGA